MPKNGVNTLQSSMKSTLYIGLYPFVNTGHNTTDMQHDNTTIILINVPINLLFKRSFEIFSDILPYLVGEAEADGREGASIEDSPDDSVVESEL